MKVGDTFTTMKGNIPRTGKVVWDRGLITKILLWRSLISFKIIKVYKYDYWFVSEENNYKELAKYALKYKI